MASTFRVLAYLGVVAGLLGGIAFLIVLGLADVAGNFRALLHEDERGKAMEIHQKQIDKVWHYRCRITEELIDGKRSLAEVVSLSRELNQIFMPEGFHPVHPEAVPADEWLCLQIEKHAVAIAKSRSPAEAERVTQTIEAEIDSYRAKEGRIQLAREVPPAIGGERKQGGLRAAKRMSD